MPVFNYKVRDNNGDIEIGDIETTTEDEAANILTNKGYFVVGLVPKDQEFSVERIFSRYIVVSLKHLMVFSKQLSVMINAGLPIVESLKTLAEEESNVKFATVITEIAKKIEGGKSLSDAFADYPDVFSDIYVNMIKVGESSGKLDVVLIKISDQLNKDYDLRSKVKSAMIYPSFILLTLIAVSILMVTFVIPRLRPVLESGGVKLPFLTKVLIFASESFMKWWWVIIIVLVIIIYFLNFYFKTAHGGRYWAYFKIKIPIFGRIIRQMYMARITRTFATLLSGGINVIHALEITSDAVGNIYYKEDILSIADKVKNGTSLSEAIKDSDRFPRVVKQMVRVGESTGTMDTTVAKLADFFESEVENVINNLSKILEPLLIVIMGIGVALAVSSVIMPLYDVTKAIH